MKSIKLEECVGNRAFRLSTLELREYRNYAFAHIDLGPRFNVLYGKNAQGKTNVLEAAYLLASTRILRSSRDGDAIRDQSDIALVSGTLDESGTTLEIELTRGSRKKASLNGLGLKRAADLLGRFPCVVVSSLDMEIVRGEPSQRRLFIDLELSQAYPGYLNRLTLYRRALDQRNALLKAARETIVDEAHFETWEEPLAEHGSWLRTARIDFVNGLEPKACSTHSFFAPNESMSIEYEPKDDFSEADALRDALRRFRGSDIARGSTTIGAHRDDLSVQINGTDLRTHGSQGQQRSGVISLKLATLAWASGHLGATPALLLDDVFSDLDAERRARLVEWVSMQSGQTVLTCTEPEAAGEAILDQAKLFKIESGAVTEG